MGASQSILGTISNAAPAEPAAGSNGVQTGTKYDHQGMVTPSAAIDQHLNRHNTVKTAKETSTVESLERGRLSDDTEEGHTAEVAERDSSTKYPELPVVSFDEEPDLYGAHRRDKHVFAKGESCASIFMLQTDVQMR